MKAKSTITMSILRFVQKTFLMTSIGKSTETSSTNSWLQRKNPLQALIGFRKASTDVEREGEEEAYSLRRNQFVFWRVILCLRCLPLFAQNRTVTDVDNNGKIVGPFEAPRPLTLCKCDCKKFTTRICRGLHRHTMRNIHLSQRCFSVRQMTDNIFENIALAHVACAPRESDILLTDFAPVVQRNGFLFAMAFRPYRSFVPRNIIPRNLAGLDFLRAAPYLWLCYPQKLLRSNNLD